MSAHAVLRAARPDDLPGILEVTCRAFGESARERMFNQLYHDSGHRLEQSRVAEVAGKIVSYVRVSDRPIRYGCVSLRMGGIGAVSTLPEYSGRGLGTALLEDAIAYMRSAGYHLSMLFTGIGPFYARLAWVPFPEHSFRFPVGPAEPARVAGGYLVRRFDLGRDLAAVERVYDDYNAGRAGPYLRHPQYWRDGHSRVLGVLPALVAEREGEVVAYASFRTAPDAVWLYEGGCRAEAAGAFRPLAAAIVGEAVAGGKARIAGQLPRSHGLLAALQEHGAAPIEGRLLQHMMLRVIDLGALLRAALPEIAERLRRSPGTVGAPRAVGFRVAGDYARLLVERDAVTVDSEPAERCFDLPVDLFFRLFLGERPLELVREELAVRGVTLREDERALLATLFPTQDPFYWLADHF